MIDQTFLCLRKKMVRVRAKIIQRVNDYKDGMMDDPELAAKITKFRCLINDEYEEVVAYSDIVDYIEQDDTWDGVWKFKEILDHKIVKANDKDTEDHDST
jgi:hypothetical protein